MPTRRRAAATPVAFVRALLLAYEKYGQARIPPKLLGREQARITARQMEALATAAMQELDDETLGWYSRRLPWGSMGMLCRASLTAPDLGVALTRWCRHHRLLTDDVLLSLARVGNVATLAVKEETELGPMRELCLLTTLRYVHGYACWLVDSRIPLRSASFPFAAPTHREVYPLIFPGPIHFSSSRAGFSFDARYLDMPVRRDERAMRSMLKRALPLTLLQYRRDRLLVQRVRGILAAGDSAPRTAEEVARAANVSVRSLYRHLKEEGASLQSLKDEVRCDLAVDQLSRSSMPVKQVARRAGFRSEKSFARAFRRWVGMSPSEFRAKPVGGRRARRGAG
jgi:AraC-like DNA-binding protein